jgi:phosphoglycerate dehydrogenase-like enzyme
MVHIVVPNTAAHGISSDRCVERLQDRLEGHKVVKAGTSANELELIRDAEVYIGGRFRPEFFEHAENLRLFASASAGVGHLDLNEFRDHGIAVTNASGVHGPNIAEHVIGWMLMFTRRLDEGLRRQSRGEWRHFQMRELKGSSVCVVGLGAIGQAIVERLQGFGVDTIGVRYTPEKGGPTDEVYAFTEIEEALIDTDWLVIACPLTQESEGLIGERELGVLPADATVINVARGKILDTEALVTAIQRNQLGAAALDVTDPEPLPADHPLWTFENVFITPHNAGHTPHYWERVADILVRNIDRVEKTGEYKGLENQVI